MLELIGGSILAIGCEAPRASRTASSPAADPVLAIEPLQTPWQTEDPFLFCAHHLDAYPPGNGVLGPIAPLRGRRIGQDFAGIDGWNMYHGRRVPGFPRHPHRGFETVTVVRSGLLDHSDSLGATARYGRGDVQWLTAGGGIQHAEMFPLVDPDDDNPLELFQIWLNLPSASKMVEAHFSMLWAPTIPQRVLRDEAGRSTVVRVVAGTWGETGAPAPPPASWASERDHHVGIWTLELDPGAQVELPPAAAGVRRAVYLHRGDAMRLGPRAVPASSYVRVRSDEPVLVQASATGASLLVLQGRPIDEPIVRHGPFVMNTEAEIRAAYADYRHTQFGGWPWSGDEPVHEREEGRFARRPDGTIERPG